MGDHLSGNLREPRLDLVEVLGRADMMNIMPTR